VPSPLEPVPGAAQPKSNVRKTLDTTRAGAAHFVWLRPSGSVPRPAQLIFGNGRTLSLWTLFQAQTNPPGESGHVKALPRERNVLGVGNVRFGTNARNVDKSALHPGPDVLQRHRCVAEYDDGQWNEQFGAERRFGWRQFERRSQRDAVDSQRPMWRWFPNGCVG
jgi:hypothetical protein